MSENERRAREALARYHVWRLDGITSTPWRDLRVAITAALDAAEERGRAAGMAEAAQIARDHDDRAGQTIGGLIDDAARGEDPVCDTCHGEGLDPVCPECRKDVNA